MHKSLFITQCICLSIVSFIFGLIASNSLAAEYDDVVRRLQEEKGKAEELLRQCDAIAKQLSDDYTVTYMEYSARKDGALKEEYFDFLKITKKRQLALPKYRKELGDTIVRINLQLRRLGQERVIPTNIINTFEDFNQTISKLLSSNFFDLVTQYNITDAEVERLILSATQRQADYDRFMEEGEEHLRGGRYGDAEMSFTKALQVEEYEADDKAKARLQAVKAARVHAEKCAAAYAGFIKYGDEAMSNKRYADAERLFRQAMQVDGYGEDEIAAAGLQAARAAIDEENKARNAGDYTRFLKEGEEHLSGKRYGDALTSFNQALLLDGYKTDARARDGAQTARHELEKYMAWVRKQPIKFGEKLTKSFKVADGWWIEKGASLMSFAALQGNLDVMEWLKSNGEDVNAKDHSGETPMYHAAWSGQVAAMEWLKSNGVGLNTRDGAGDTPLHEAAYSGKIEAMKWLMSNDADVNAKNNKSKTPFDATNKNDAKVWLTENGGKSGLRDEYARLMNIGEEHLSGNQYHDAIASFRQAMRLEGYESDEKAKSRMKAAWDVAGVLTIYCSPEIEMQFVLIPAGEFKMGSPESEGKYKTTAHNVISDKLEEMEGRDSGEIQHTVTLSKHFYMSIYEVTQAQYHAIMGKNPSHFKGDDLPVGNVSWEDAQEFCHKLSDKTGRNVRLPTEAEWEYTCRAGTTTPFYFGETINTDQANYNGDYIYGNGRKGEFRGKTTPVGTFRPNAWGLYDMHGNVSEWCSDWYDSYPTGSVTNPTGPSNGTARVLRGGSWLYFPVDCRSASRSWSQPGERSNWVGFRVSLDN